MSKHFISRIQVYDGYVCFCNPAGFDRQTVLHNCLSEHLLLLKHRGL